jgi:fatty-acyl-CoA synthase
VREHLAPHKTPPHWFVVDAMPLTGSGKIQKFKLREQWSKGGMTELDAGAVGDRWTLRAASAWLE